MTFSQEVKRELCRIEPKQACCGWAQLYGMLLFSRTFPEEEQVFATESQRAAELFAQLAAGLAGAFVTVRTDPRTRLEGRYAVLIEDAGQRELLRERFGLGVPVLNPHFVEKDCCVAAFFRGIFLLYGSIVNPEREYHLELAAPDEFLAEETALLGRVRGFHWKQSRRKGVPLLYLKESGQIEDFLTFIGAPKVRKSSICPLSLR